MDQQLLSWWAKALRGAINVSNDTLRALLREVCASRHSAEEARLPDRNLDAERRRNHEPFSIGTLELFFAGQGWTHKVLRGGS